MSVRRFKPLLESLEGREVPTCCCAPYCPPAQCCTAPICPPLTADPTTSAVKPVLMVIANRDFYYSEYSQTRAALEAAGLNVRVTAAALTYCVPHWASGQGADGGIVLPDLAITSASADDYSAIVFVGGWGASSYQYAFEGTYQNPAYNGTASVREATNELINDFVAQDKYVCGLCHGVSVLAYARVDGVSLLDGRTVATYEGSSPLYTLDGVFSGWQADRLHIEANGGAAFASGAIGDPSTVADDVWVDGKIITGQNFDSATRFGQVIAQQVFADLN